jgi:hypothetical protein
VADYGFGYLAAQFSGLGFGVLRLRFAKIQRLEL